MVSGPFVSVELFLHSFGMTDTGYPIHTGAGTVIGLRNRSPGREKPGRLLGQTMATITEDHTITSDLLETITKEAPPVEATPLLGSVKVMPTLSHPLYQEMEWFWGVVAPVSIDGMRFSYDGREADEWLCICGEHISHFEPGDAFSVGLTRNRLFDILGI